MKTNLLFLCLALTACQGLVGSGRVVTQDREITPFKRLAVHSGINAVTTNGPRGLTVRTDDNVQSLVETFVQGDTLVVRLQHDTVLMVGRVEATISNDVFEALDASGGSNVTITATPITRFDLTASGGSDVQLRGLSSDDFTVDASGGSDVTIEGTANRADVIASGGSTLRLKDVALESLALDASGGSTVNARVSSMITGSASGGSTVTIVGTPTNRVDRSGGSEVSVGR